MSTNLKATGLTYEECFGVELNEESEEDCSELRDDKES